MRLDHARISLVPCFVRQRLLRWIYGIRLVEQDEAFGTVYLDCVHPSAHVTGAAIGMLIGLAGPKALALLPGLTHATLVGLQFGAFLVSMLVAFPHLFLLFKRLEP